MAIDDTKKMILGQPGGVLINMRPVYRGLAIRHGSYRKRSGPGRQWRT